MFVLIGRLYHIHMLVCTCGLGISMFGNLKGAFSIDRNRFMSF